MSDTNDIASHFYGDGAPSTTPESNSSGGLAARLYGDQQPEQMATKQASDKAVRTGEDIAASMYPEREEQQGNPYALEKGTTDRLYGATNNVRIPEHLDTAGLLDQGGDAETLRTNLGYIAAEAGATEADVTGMVGIAQDFVRSGQKVENEGQREQILSEVMSQGSFTDNHLADARDLVGSYPDLADWLARTGAGDDPKMVGRMLKIAQTPRAQRRIQQYRNRSSRK